MTKLCSKDLFCYLLFILFYTPAHLHLTTCASEHSVKLLLLSTLWQSSLNFISICQVTKLQSDISPLHHSLSQLSEKNGALQADKRILEEDLRRWKAKAQVTTLHHARMCVCVCVRASLPFIIPFLSFLLQLHYNVVAACTVVLHYVVPTVIL